MRTSFILIVAVFLSIVVGAVLVNAPRDAIPVDDDKENTQEIAPGILKSPGDLTGDWVTEADENVKFVAEIRNGTILIHMTSASTLVAYYYGTWPAEPNADNVFHSVKLEDPQKVIASTAVGKDFLWRGDRIAFNYTFGPVTTAIEMVREK